MLKSKILIGVSLIISLMITGCSDLLNDNPDIVKVRGRVVDGPIKESVCFADLNDNTIWDEGEPKGVSNDKGYYEYSIESSLLSKNNKIKSICMGGIDTITNVQLKKLELVTLISSSSDNIIYNTPLNTVLSFEKTDTGKSEMLTKFGITADLTQVLLTDHYEQAHSSEDLTGKVRSEAITLINYQLINLILGYQNLLTNQLPSKSDQMNTSKIISIAIQNIIKKKEKESINSAGNIFTEEFTKSVFAQVKSSIGDENLTPNTIIIESIIKAADKIQNTKNIADLEAVMTTIHEDNNISVTPDIDELEDDVMRLLEAGNHDQAKQKLIKITVKEPAHATANLILAVLTLNDSIVEIGSNENLKTILSILDINLDLDNISNVTTSFVDLEKLASEDNIGIINDAFNDYFINPNLLKDEMFNITNSTQLLLDDLLNTLDEVTAYLEMFIQNNETIIIPGSVIKSNEDAAITPTYVKIIVSAIEGIKIPIYAITTYDFSVANETLSDDESSYELNMSGKMFLENNPNFLTVRKAENWPMILESLKRITIYFEEINAEIDATPDHELAFLKTIFLDIFAEVSISREDILSSISRLKDYYKGQSRDTNGLIIDFPKFFSSPYKFRELVKLHFDINNIYNEILMNEHMINTENFIDKVLHTEISEDLYTTNGLFPTHTKEEFVKFISISFWLDEE
ncbi:MAG: hypothetical protein CMP21_08565 [Rickettsiales bacterium]|mgnify:CR=1 FL=1|nr:hypothetical protein [Rickettsiales bacterium]|tara:strand:+ start:84 stop:2150 length:2067 start_codon:yes stop_codon:yes gene_type:complete